MTIFLILIVLLMALVIAGIGFYAYTLREKNQKLKNHTEELNEHIKETEKFVETQVNDRFRGIPDLDEEKQKVQAEIDILTTKFQIIKNNCKSTSQKSEDLEKQIALYNDEIEMFELGFYNPHFDYDAPEQYKIAILKNKDKQKLMGKSENNQGAIYCYKEMQFDGSTSKGKKMISKIIKLTTRAFNGDCDSLISSVNWSNASKLEIRIVRSFTQINKLNEMYFVEINKDFLLLKLEELRLVHEHKIKLKDWKEEQAAVKAQMKEEEKIEREAQKAIDESKKNEEQYSKLLEKARQEAELASGLKLEEIKAKMERLSLQLDEAKQNTRKKSLAQQTKRGYIYVLSNVGCFGDGIFKIGMTRRNEPLDRVKELGDASVPFLFDVHAMILVENAPAFEKYLHRVFDFQRVNLINKRKEFFRVSLDDIEDEVKKAVNNPDFTISNPEFTITAQAKEFRESQAIIEQRKIKAA